MENWVRELLQEVADEVPRYLDVPPRLESRARRRIAVTVGAAMASVVAIALGAGQGPKSLMAAPAPAPADRGPTETTGQTRTYRANPLTLHVPGGWDRQSWADEVMIGPNLESGDSRTAIVVSRDTWAPASFSGCPAGGPRAGSPASAEEIARWIAANPNLDTSGPQPVTVDGVGGVQLDVTAAADAALSCEQSRQHFVVPVVVVHEYSTGRHPWGVTSEERMRVYLFDVPATGLHDAPESTKTIAMLIITKRDSFDRFLAQALPVIESAEFAAGGAS